MDKRRKLIILMPDEEVALPKEISAFQWGLDTCKNHDGLLVDNLISPHDHYPAGLIEDAAMWVEAYRLQFVFDDGYEGTGLEPTQNGILLQPNTRYVMQALAQSPTGTLNGFMKVAIGTYTPGEQAVTSNVYTGALVLLGPGAWSAVAVAFQTNSVEDYLCGASLEWAFDL